MLISACEDSTGARVTRSLLRFFSLTYALAWISWAASRAISHGSGVVLLLGVFAPGIIALVLTERGEGRAATRALIARVFKWNVGVRWYVFAIAYIPAIKLVVALVHRIVTGGWPPGATNPFVLNASLVGWLTVAFLWVAAAYFLVKMRGGTLAEPRP